MAGPSSVASRVRRGRVRTTDETPTAIGGGIILPDGKTSRVSGTVVARHAGVRAAGSIDFTGFAGPDFAIFALAAMKAVNLPAAADLETGDGFAVDDGTNPEREFIFDVDDSFTAGANQTRIPLVGSETQTQVNEAAVAAVGAAGLDVTAKLDNGVSCQVTAIVSGVSSSVGVVKVGNNSEITTGAMQSGSDGISLTISDGTLSRVFLLSLTPTSLAVGPDVVLDMTGVDDPSDLPTAIATAVSAEREAGRLAYETSAAGSVLMLTNSDPGAAGNGSLITWALPVDTGIVITQPTGGAERDDTGAGDATWEASAAFAADGGALTQLQGSGLLGTWLAAVPNDTTLKAYLEVGTDLQVVATGEGLAGVVYDWTAALER